MELQQNSKKTMWLLVGIGAAVILAIVSYWMMNANKGAELLEGSKSPETTGAVQGEIEESLNSFDLGNLEGDINNLDADINKL